MQTTDEAKTEFWRALRSDMTVMLGLDEPGHDARPMTAQMLTDEDHGPIWFFTSTDSHLVRELAGEQPAQFSFVGKSHGVFASVQGTMSRDNDPAVIDALWNPFVAAWYEGGKTDPKLVLLKFDPGTAKIWFDANSLFAGIKMMLGIDPKEDYADKVATVAL